MNDPLDVPCIIHLLRNCHRPLDLVALMDDAAAALEKYHTALEKIAAGVLPIQYATFSDFAILNAKEALS